MAWIWDVRVVGAVVAVVLGAVGFAVIQVYVDLNREASRRQKFADRLFHSLQRSESSLVGTIRNELQKLRTGLILAVAEKESREDGEELRALSKGVQELRSEVEWFEEILAGMNQNLGSLRSDISVRIEGLRGERSEALQMLTDQIRRTSRSISSGQSSLTVAPPRTLAATARWSDGTYSSRRVNSLLGTMETSDSSYLEIGVEAGKTLEAVQAVQRVGVEPRPRFDVANLPADVSVFVGGSDTFFRQLESDQRFDVIFVDGLHEFRQTYRDLLNALRHLREGGAILIDDVVPSDEISAIADLSRSIDERRSLGMPGLPWHGDVYKLVAVIDKHHPELSYNTIVGSGNDQIVLWWQDRTKQVHGVDDPTLDRYSQLSFDEVFSDGVPEYFRPVDEDTAIANAQGAREDS